MVILNSDIYLAMFARIKIPKHSILYLNVTIFTEKNTEQVKKLQYFNNYNVLEETRR